MGKCNLGCEGDMKGKERQWDNVGMHLLGEGKVEKAKFMVSTTKMKLWLLKAITTLLFWICVVQFVSVGEVRGPKLLKTWPSCFNYSDIIYAQSKLVHPPKRIYKSNGYLIVSCNGGLNQMRAAICDMVSIARYLNITLIVPALDKTSFWADPSDFQDIFDVDRFITSLRDEVRILKQLPARLNQRFKQGKFYELSPISWSNISYYNEQILPLLHKYKVVHLNRTDSRLANNGLPLEVQKLRCRVNFDGLRFTSRIEEMGSKVVQHLRRNGPFLVLHLRYEMDMLAFSGCNRGCYQEEVAELTRMRYANPLWKEKEINSELKRIEGQCPLTPEETAIVLKALDIDSNIQIYIAAGDIYGGNRRMKSLLEFLPKLVTKEMLVQPNDLTYYQNHASQMAALDYLISLEGDIFVPTYDGNMARLVEGHRRHLGFKKSISLDRKDLVNLIDQYSGGLLNWDDFSNGVKRTHLELMGAPRKRIQIQDKPKEEEFFYANPEECLQTQDALITNVESMSR